MPKSHFVDLRERVLNHLEGNSNKEEASLLFQVGIATIYRWVERKKSKGNVEPFRRKVETLTEALDRAILSM